jgi:hypothetical protein
VCFVFYFSRRLISLRLKKGHYQLLLIVFYKNKKMNKNMFSKFSLIALMMAIGVFGVHAHKAHAAINVVSTCGTTISTAGTYVLAADLDCSTFTGTAVDIESAGVIFDFQGKTLTAGGLGINIGDFAVTVQSTGGQGKLVAVNVGTHGIVTSQATATGSNSFSNFDLVGPGSTSAGDGIVFLGSGFNAYGFTNMNFTGWSSGFYTQGAKTNTLTFTNDTFSNNLYGVFFLADAGFNGSATFTNTSMTNNTRSGLESFQTAPGAVFHFTGGNYSDNGHDTNQLGLGIFIRFGSIITIDGVTAHNNQNQAIGIAADSVTITNTNADNNALGNECVAVSDAIRGLTINNLSAKGCDAGLAVIGGKVLSIQGLTANTNSNAAAYGLSFQGGASGTPDVSTAVFKNIDLRNSNIGLQVFAPGVTGALNVNAADGFLFGGAPISGGGQAFADIWIDSANNASFTGLNLTQPGQYGILAQNSNGLTLKEVTAQNKGNGFFTSNGNNIKVIAGDFSHNAYGVQNAANTFPNGGFTLFHTNIYKNSQFNFYDGGAQAIDLSSGDVGSFWGAVIDGPECFIPFDSASRRPSSGNQDVNRTLIIDSRCSNTVVTAAPVFTSGMNISVKGKDNTTKVPKDFDMAYPVKVFKYEAGTCAADIGVQPKNAGTIFNTCTAANVGTETNANDFLISHLVKVGAPTGDVLVVVQSAKDVNGNFAYVMFKNPGLKDGEYRDNGFQRAPGQGLDYVQTAWFITNSRGVIDSASSASTINGSRLDVYQPDYIDWSNPSEIYPFMFISDSDWDVNVCLSVPAGYTIAAPGTCDQTLVNSETKIVEFTVNDIGSPKNFNAHATINVTHKGKKTKVDLDVPSHNKNGKGGQVTLAHGQNLWQAVKMEVGDIHPDLLKAAVKKVAQHNNIAIPEWGISGGIDSRKLQAGAVINFDGILGF